MGSERGRGVGEEVAEGEALALGRSVCVEPCPWIESGFCRVARGCRAYDSHRESLASLPRWE
jgi:hypothetical protein